MVYFGGPIMFGNIGPWPNVKGNSELYMSLCVTIIPCPVDTITMQLQTETAYFDHNRKRWLKEGHEGKWCVIQGEKLLGFYTDMGKAYLAGTKEFGEDATFLVKELLPEDPIATIQRAEWRADGQWAI